LPERMLALTTGALPALALVASSPANTQTQVAFRHLVLAGPLVEWGAPVLGTGATVTLAVVRDEQQFPGARNCCGIGLIDGLLAASDRPGCLRCRTGSRTRRLEPRRRHHFLAGRGTRRGHPDRRRDRGARSFVHQRCLSSTATWMSTISAALFAARSATQSGSIIRAARGRSRTFDIAQFGCYRPATWPAWWRFRGLPLCG